MMKFKNIVLGLSLGLTACQSTSETDNNYSLSNFEYQLPENCSIKKSQGMEKLKIVCSSSDSIMIYNFGNRPTNLSSNVERWKNQLDTTLSLSETSYHNNTVFLYQINGLSDSKETTIMASIIPSKEGPYFFKSTLNTDNQKFIEKFKDLVESVNYKK